MQFTNLIALTIGAIGVVLNAEKVCAKRTRLKKIYRSSDPNDLTLYSKEVTDIPQPDCCYCIMRPVPPQFIPAAE